MSQNTIPAIYHITFNWFEPFMAAAGALQLHLAPDTYLKLANPNTRPYFRSELQPLMTSIMGGWLILAFNDAVTLRVFYNDIKVWTCIMASHLISDLVYCSALIQDLGFERFANPAVWNAADWLTIATTLPPLVLKISFLLGLGLNSNSKRKRG